MWWVAASMALSAGSSYMKNKAENEAGMKDAKLRKERIGIAKGKAINAHEDNMDTINEQSSIDQMGIDIASGKALGDLKVHTASSGLAGGLVEDMEREVELGVAADEVAAGRQERLSTEQSKRELENTMENLENQELGLYKEKSNFGVSDALGVAAAGYSTYSARTPIK